MHQIRICQCRSSLEYSFALVCSYAFILTIASNPPESCIGIILEADYSAFEKQFVTDKQDKCYEM